MICPNCNTQHGCECKILTASDGKQVCTSCIQKYELSKASNSTQSSSNNVAGIPVGPITPVVNSVTFNNLNS